MRERRCGDEREAVDQIAHARDRHQNADRFRHEARTVNQNADDDAKASEEQQAHPERIGVSAESEGRDVAAGRQDGLNQAQRAVRFDRDGDDVEKNREDREVPIHRPKQDVENREQRDRTNEQQKLGGDVRAPERFVRANRVGGGQPAADEHFAP